MNGVGFMAQALQSADLRTFKGFRMELYWWGAMMLQMHHPRVEPQFAIRNKIYEDAKREARSVG